LSVGSATAVYLCQEQAVFCPGFKNEGTFVQTPITFENEGTF